MGERLLNITESVPTPFLLVEEEILRSNIGRLHEYSNRHGFAVRPQHDVSRCNPPPRVGQRLSIVPVNVSLCVNLYDYFYLITRSGTLQMESIDARGCLV